MADTCMQNDEHIIEADGRARITIRGGKVVSVTAPQIRECPLAKRFKYPLPLICEDEIKKNIEARIADFGMCTPQRKVLSSEDFVLFGASELMMSAVRAGIIDCAVIACDGAGSVIAPTPQLIQGIGGKMSGLVKTIRYPEVVKRIEDAGGYVPFEDARIDGTAACRAAEKLGYKKPAVTTASPAEAEKLRAEYPDAAIIAVHTTGISGCDADIYAETCDLIFACASKEVRRAASSALVQGGTGVPVFAMTEKGKEIILEKIRSSKTPVVIKGEKLPAASERMPSPLI